MVFRILLAPTPLTFIAGLGKIDSILKNFLPSASISSRQLERASVALACTLLVVLFALMFKGLYSDSIGSASHSHLQGDFPAFYAAGVLVKEGESIASLYDPSLQAAIQSKYFGFDQFYLEYAYPPFVAQFFSLFAEMGPYSAKFCYLLIQMVLLVFSMRAVSFRTGYSFWILLAAALSFLPLFSSIAGGQNSLFAFLLVLYMSEDLSKKNGSKLGKALLPGICLGVLCYKPQLAFIAATIFLMSGIFRPLFVASFIWLGCFLLSAFNYGLSWPLVWLSAVGEFGSKDNQANLSQQISLYVLPDFFNIELLASLVCLTVLLGFLIRLNLKGRAVSGEFLGPLLVLFSPHLLYYEASILLPSLFAYLKNARVPQVSFLFIWVLVALAVFF